MGRIVDELKTVIGFEISKNSERNLKKAKNGISSLRKQALLAGAAFAGFGIAAEKIIQGVDQQAKFARSIGISFESLRKFQFAAKKAGASASEFNAFIGTLSRTIVSLEPGQFNKALFRLGVAGRDAAGKIRPLDDVILDISEGLKRFGAIRRLQLTQSLGASFNITNFLGQSTDAIRRDLQEAVTTGFVIPERLTGQFAEFFDDSLLKLRSTIQGFSEVMVGALLPSITKIVDSLEEWILKNKKLLATDIGDFLKGAGDAFDFFGKAIKIAFDAISLLISPITKVNKELSEAKILGFAAASAVVALSAAAIAASAEWVILGAAISAVIFLIVKADDAIDALAEKFKIFEDFKDIFKKVNPFSGLIDKPKEAVKGLINSLSNSDSGALNASDGEVSAIAPQNVTNNSANRNVTLNNTFNISGATDPLQTAKRVTEQLELARALQTGSPGFNRPRVA